MKQNQDVNKEEEVFENKDENSSELTKQTSTNVDTETEKECSDINNDNRSEKHGIYTSPGAIITGRNKINEGSSNSGIYIAPNQMTTSDSNNFSVSVNKQELKSGIYMLPQQGTSQ